MHYLKYSLWPLIKVKCTHLWWSIKYGGKKNIPPELIFGQMEKSMKRFSDSMQQAFRHMPQGASDSEKGEMVDLMGLAQKLEAEIKRLEAEKK